MQIKYHSNILETVGDTPLVQLHRVVDSKGLVLAKIESCNPGGSVKDRIAIKMIDVAEQEGRITPGGTIVEPTSGNTGAGLALVGAVRGYKLIFTMPDKMSMEKEQILRAYGAEVIRTPTAVAPEDPRSYYKVAERITAETENAFSPSQYFNQNNPLAHYQSTGPEIWDATAGRISYFVAGIGTGGTITGVSRYLRERNPQIKIVGVDTEGSIYHHTFDNTEGDIHVYKTEGIGEDFVPDTVDLALLDEIVVVSDADAFRMARRLAREEGILSGSSCGSAVCAVRSIQDRLSTDDVVVTLLPDTGKNYLSTVYNDRWMEENKLL